MTSKTMRLLGATALLALATPAFADDTDSLLVDQQRQKIATARAEPGVARYGSAELDQATAELATLKDNLDEDESGQAKAIVARIDALVDTARTRANIARMKDENNGMRAENSAKVADARAAAQAAQADAANARAEADALRSRMREYQMKQTQLGATLVLRDVMFETGKADLKPGAAERLRPLAQYLTSNPKVRVRIDGHTDAQGSDSFNQALSDRRAAAVRTALAGMGVMADRMDAVGHGESQPVASNANAAGRQQNRRVEVTLMGQQASSLAALP